jgi:hypothetical protein
MQQKPDKIDRFKEIVIGRRNGTQKQLEQLARFRFAFSLACEGYSSWTVANALEEKYLISKAQAYRLITDAKYIFGDATQFVKAGERRAMYEYLMKLAKKAESAGDFTTARNCIKDAIELMGFDKESESGVEDPMAYMQPQAFLVSDDSRLLDKAIDKLVDIEDVEFEIVPLQDAHVGKSGLSEQ